jgi:hypothetical protein
VGDSVFHPYTCKVRSGAWIEPSAARYPLMRYLKLFGLEVPSQLPRSPFRANFRFADNAELTQRQGQAYIQRSESPRFPEGSLHLGTRAAVEGSPSVRQSAAH